ncbi:mucin-5AC [Drosophila subpulchrella]|uniref:mucin-5AC n=1 Tax=Drosophila subpulchrella TaxID=1486046 RepID=UPI0018A1A262|nr:mucin-5AC [Drosophila subpulchrella]
MSGATEGNLLLLRAVEKQPPLYDRGDENYRKRLPSENSWDMVASEVGESVEKCKRRWRQLRNDYTRWCNADAHRRRKGQRRLAYPLADELRFLDRHLNLAEDIGIDDERSVSSDKDRDRDSNRDSESRDHLQQQPQVSSKDRAASVGNSVKEAKLIRKVREEKSLREEEESLENQEDQEQAEDRSPEEELFEPEEPEKVPEQDSYLQSDNEGDECVDEEHLEELEGFDFDIEQTMHEKESSPEKSLETDHAESPASQSEFFIKESNDPHLLIISKKNSAASVGEPEDEDSNSGDPLEEAMDESMEDSGEEYAGYGKKRAAGGDDTTSPSRRRRRGVRTSISSAGIKELPIRKPLQGQRITRLQRRKSMSVAAVHSVRSSTSPVKMTPVPRSQPYNKPPSGQVQIKKVGLRDDIFPRPTASAGGQNQSKTPQQQKSLIFPKNDAMVAIPQVPAPPKRSVGRPPKKLQLIQRLVDPQPRPQSPKVLTITKPSSSTVNNSSNSSNVSNKNSTISSSSSSTTTTKVTTSNSLKTEKNDNITVMSFSSTSTSTTSPSASGTVVTAIPTASTGGSSVSVPPYVTVSKRGERGTQTDSPSVFSDEHFLEMIKPQMQEMNSRQKMHFKKKVFQALMETFDDATDFPTAGELQHFNINTPSGFEHVSDPEMRLVRELVSLVSAAKVTVIRPPADNAPVASRSPAVSDALRAPRPNMPRHVIQRVYKQGTGLEIASNNTTGAGQEKKLYRILQMSGKPNGNMSASLDNLRKESVDSAHGTVRVTNSASTASPKGATIVAAVRPQGSSINTFFGQPNGAQPVKSGPPVKVRAMSRRYSVCGSSNPPNGQTTSPSPATTGSSLNSNLNPMEAAMLKRRLIAPTQGMVPPSQRPRYSAGQLSAVSHGGSLLVRKSMGPVPGSQKQISPTGRALTPQKTPQIASVQGSVFNDFVQPKAAAAPSASGDGSSPSSALKRSLVVANTKTSFQDLLQQPTQPLQRKKKESSETAATIAADDFSLASLKREPVDHIDDQDDILGM